MRRNLCQARPPLSRRLSGGGVGTGIFICKAWPSAGSTTVWKNATGEGLGFGVRLTGPGLCYPKPQLSAHKR